MSLHSIRVTSGSPTVGPRPVSFSRLTASEETFSDSRRSGHFARHRAVEDRRRHSRAGGENEGLVVTFAQPSDGSSRSEYAAVGGSFPNSSQNRQSSADTERSGVNFQARLLGTSGPRMVWFLSRATGNREDSEPYEALRSSLQGVAHNSQFLPDPVVAEAAGVAASPSDFRPASYFPSVRTFCFRDNVPFHSLSSLQMNNPERVNVCSASQWPEAHTRAVVNELEQLPPLEDFVLAQPPESPTNQFFCYVRAIDDGSTPDPSPRECAYSVPTSRLFDSGSMGYGSSRITSPDARAAGGVDRSPTPTAMPDVFLLVSPSSGTMPISLSPKDEPTSMEVDDDITYNNTVEFGHLNHTNDTTEGMTERRISNPLTEDLASQLIIAMMEERYGVEREEGREREHLRGREVSHALFVFNESRRQVNIMQYAQRFTYAELDKKERRYLVEGLNKRMLRQEQDYQRDIKSIATSLPTKLSPRSIKLPSIQRSGANGQRCSISSGSIPSLQGTRSATDALSPAGHAEYERQTNVLRAQAQPLIGHYRFFQDFL